MSETVCKWREVTTVTEFEWGEVRRWAARGQVDGRVYDLRVMADHLAARAFDPHPYSFEVIPAADDAKAQRVPWRGQAASFGQALQAAEACVPGLVADVSATVQDVQSKEVRLPFGTELAVVEDRILLRYAARLVEEPVRHGLVDSEFQSEESGRRPAGIECSVDDLLAQVDEIGADGRPPMGQGHEVAGGDRHDLGL
jgi:hypothetical protein